MINRSSGKLETLASSNKDFFGALMKLSGFWVMHHFSLKSQSCGLSTTINWSRFSLTPYYKTITVRMSIILMFHSSDGLSMALTEPKNANPSRNFLNASEDYIQVTCSDKI